MAQSDFVSRGQELLAAGQYPEAVRVCRLGLLARPTELGGRLVLGQALLALRRYDEVLGEMRVALELDRHNAGALQLQGEALLRKNEPGAALEVLERARTLAPSDPTIGRLFAEARIALAAGGRTTGRSAAFIENETKHYPGGPGEGPDTERQPRVSEPRRRSEARPPADARDRAGTVDVDPDVDGVELADDELVEVPERASTAPVDEDDLVEDGDEPTRLDGPMHVAATEGPDPNGRRSPAARFLEEAPTLLRDDALEPPTIQVPTRAPADPASPRSRLEEAPTLLRDDPLEPPTIQVPTRAPVDPAPPRPRTASAPVPSAAIAPPRPRTPSAPVPSAAIAPPWPRTPSAPVPSPVEPSRLRTPSAPVPSPPASPDWFAPPAPSAPPAPLARPVADDMDVIRRGLAGGSADDTVVTGPVSEVPVVPARPRRRRRLRLVMWSLLTGGMIGGGVVAGFWIRAVRLDRQVAAARKTADLAARTDSWTGWIAARDRLVGIDLAQPSPAHRAALARARAVLAADFRDDVDGARTAVGELGDAPGADAALARAYLALADGDADRARRAVANAGPATDPAIGLVLARAALVESRWDDAATAAHGAAERDPRPATWVASCIAETGRKRWREAERACGAALALVPGHPSAVIARARARAASGAARQDAATLVGELEGLIGAASRPPDPSALGVSPGQAAWAQLALAEVQLAAGDGAAAHRARERAEAARVDHRAFVEALAALALALGDQAAARRTAEQGLTRWPSSVAFAVVRARALLAAGDVADAGAAIDRLTGAATTSLDVQVTRAHIELARGELAGAAARLDGVLARAPDFEDAVVTRADVDLARGDAAAALARVEPRLGPGAAPRLVVAYAAAKRALRQIDAARAALAPLQGGAPGPLTGRVWLETGRLERDAGDLAAARTAYARAAEMMPGAREVRLESALLSIDDGDAAGGRDALVRLVADAPDDASVLLAAARAQTLTGALAAAQTLIEQAERAGGSKTALARERGRLAQRRRDPAAAVAGLETAVQLEPDELETRLLLMDAYYLAGNESDAQRQADDMLRRFPGRAETFLALGRQALRGERAAEALTQFGKARELLAKAPRRRLADAEFWLAYASYYSDDLARAKQLLLEAVNLDPFHADARAALGLVLGDLNDPGGAAAALERSLAMDPENTEGYFLLGQALIKAHRAREARPWLEKYLARAPDGDNAATARKLLR